MSREQYLGPSPLWFKYLRLADQACTRIAELQNAIQRVRMLAPSAWKEMYRLLHFQCPGGAASACGAVAVGVSNKICSMPAAADGLKGYYHWLLVVPTVYDHCSFSSSVSLGLAEASLQAWHFVWCPESVPPAKEPVSSRTLTTLPIIHYTIKLQKQQGISHANLFVSKHGRQAPRLLLLHGSKAASVTC